MVSAMKAVHFNSTTIEALMEALYHRDDDRKQLVNLIYKVADIIKTNKQI